MRERTCVFCGDGFIPTNNLETRCSQACKSRDDCRKREANAAARARKRAYNREWRRENADTITARRRPGGRYAESEARAETRRKHRRRAQNKLRLAAKGRRGRYQWTAGRCLICDEPFTDWSASRTCGPRCSKRLKQRRAQARKRSRYRLLRTAVFDRDGWLCGICGDAVNRDAVVPELDAGVLDHIHPRAHGGSDELANLQCAHFYCNSVKQDQVGFTAIAS